MNNKQRHVVITGLGTLNPLGNDPDATWAKVARSQSGIGPITRFDASDYKTKIAGEVKEFDPQAIFGRRDARRMARPTQFAMVAANQALTNARLELAKEDMSKIGVIIGCGMGNLDPITDATNLLNERGPARISPFFVPMMLMDTPAALISIEHGFQGPNMSISTACATGSNVIGEAAKMIRQGITDVMVAGGTEAAIVPLSIAGFANTGALSANNEHPERACRPFEMDRDGFVASEGAAVLILESLDHAQARGAHIYGEVRGYGSTADAYHISKPAEDGEGAVRSMRAALAEANLAPDQIDYVNAHGTGTRLNDKGETAAIKTVFGEYAYDLPVSSTKSMHGHLLGAAGCLEAIICLKGIEANMVPPTINYDTVDPDCDLDYVPNEARPKPLEIVMSNSFGFGGHNATIILGKC